MPDKNARPTSSKAKMMTTATMGLSFMLPPRPESEVRGLLLGVESVAGDSDVAAFTISTVTRLGVAAIGGIPYRGGYCSSSFSDKKPLSSRSKGMCFYYRFL
jgi:hypothetical protein